jgi:hypothetical protein
MSAYSSGKIITDDAQKPNQVYAAVLRTRLGQFVDGLFRIENTKAVVESRNIF